MTAPPTPERFDPRQRKILIGLGIALGLVLLGMLIAFLGRASPDPTALPETTTTEETTTTTEETTTTTEDTTTTEETTTTTTEETTTTTTLPLAELVVLQGDGLEVVEFGDPPDLVVTGLTGLLGPPDEDSGWVDAPSSPFGVCPGRQVRGVRWRDLLGLFTDGETPWGAEGFRHFFSYVDSVFHDERHPIGLETEEGIGLGDSRRDLEQAYGDRVEIVEDEVFGVFFQIDVPEPAVLWGHLSDSAPSALIVDIRGGSGCGE